MAKFKVKNKKGLSEEPVMDGQKKVEEAPVKEKAQVMYKGEPRKAGDVLNIDLEDDRYQQHAIDLIVNNWVLPQDEEAKKFTKKVSGEG